MTAINLVEIVGEPRSWSPKKGPAQGQTFHSYKVKDDKGTVYEINRKPESGPPKLGLDEYEITPPKEGTDFPPKLKKVQKGGFGGSKPDPERDARIARQVAFKGAVELIAGGSSGVLTDDAYVEMVGSLTEALLPIVTGETGPSVEKKVEDVAKSVSANPTPEPDSGDRAPSREAVREAYDTFIEKARDKQSAKNLVKLQTAALGIEPEQEMDEEQRTKLYQFLTSDAQ